MRAFCIGAAIASAFAAAPSASATGYHRGADEHASAHEALQSHSGEYKCSFNKQQKSVTRRGLSVFNDPKKLPQRFAKNVFHVESMPHGLEFLVIGSPGHAEVVPDKALCNEKQQLSLTGYQALLDKIKLSHSK